VFRAYCLKNFDNNGDGKIREGEVATEERIGISLAVKNIHSIEGIEYFPMLKYLAFPEQEVTFVDLSKNKLLEILYCDKNPFVKLDVSHNTELIDISCASAQLDSIDLSQNVKLQILGLGYNNLYNLDLSSCIALKGLTVDGNPMSSLDVSKNKNVRVGAHECPNLTLIYVWKGCDHSSWNVQGNVKYFEVGE
jgi:hypothetical protein